MLTTLAAALPTAIATAVPTITRTATPEATGAAAVVPYGNTGSRSYVPPTYCPGCYSHRMPMIGPILGLLFFLALVAAVIVFIALFVRKNSAYLQLQRQLQAQLASPVHQAHLILAERLARGDIDEDEYRKRMDALRAGSGFAPPPPK